MSTSSPSAPSAETTDERSPATSTDEAPDTEASSTLTEPDPPSEPTRPPEPEADPAPAEPEHATVQGEAAGPATTEANSATSGVPADAKAGDAVGDKTTRSQPPSPTEDAAPPAIPPSDPAVTAELPQLGPPAPSRDFMAPTAPIPPPQPDPTRQSFEVRTPRTEPERPPSPYAVTTEQSRIQRSGAAPPTDAQTTVAGPPPRHMRPAARGGRRQPAKTARKRPGRYVIMAVAPLVILVLLIVAWAVDTTVLSGQVPRNVEVAGHSIGGEGEDSLPQVMADIAEDVAKRPVTIKAGDKTYPSTAEALGLTVDQKRTIEDALDVGSDDAFFVRPLKWLTSFFSPREVPLRYAVSEFQTAVTLQQLQGTDLTVPVEPTIQLVGADFAITPGQVGQGIDVAKIVEALPKAARAVEGTDKPIIIEVDKTEVPPQFTDQEAQALADRANTMTAQGLSLQADSATVQLSAGQLRAWMIPQATEAGLDLAFDTEGAKAALPGMFGELGGEAVNATVSLQGGTPVVVPGRNGVVCCGEDAGTRVWDALKTGQPTVQLEATVSEPEFTTEEVQAWGITQPVGGSRAWRSGAEAEGPAPGFTTFHDCCVARVSNIHRIADLVDGAVIPPGGSFSVNDHVGQRTAAKGFVLAGAIRDGVHVDEIGGGVSQFATTTFNAAYFAGLDIIQYQAHTEYFSRYPRGREATMGYPNPDLVIENNTPYGVLVQTSYTGTSLTVTMWSTPYATAEQTNISEGTSGACAVVTTTRTRSFPDGTTKNDNFRATYRPGEGLPC